MFRKRATLVKAIIWFIVITMVLAFVVALFPAIGG